MFNFHKDHKSLMLTAVIGFLTLSILISIVPASQMQNVQPLPDEPIPTVEEVAGLNIYIGEGCVACHTQQVRNIEMDKMWGERPSLPSDYYYSKQRLDVWRQSPSLLGSERTGPDLTNIGVRQPSDDWHLMHLYNPRIVVEESVMPGYPWLFEEKSVDNLDEEDVKVAIPTTYFNKQDKTVVATEKALQLVAYLKSLKQTPLPDAIPAFIPTTKQKEQSSPITSQLASLPDGGKLYQSTCEMCHQANGKGLPGAFPPLAGSSVVNDQDPDLLIRIILQGYDARSEYGQMPGFAEQLKDEEIAAIANHERSSWGNSAPPITTEQVKKIREFVMQNL
jgi:cytochrome c oxidase cbb3-type subunit 2